MVSTFDELLTQSRSSAEADPEWIGSSEHLRLLTASLGSVFGLADVSLRWGPRGAAGYWESATRSIVLERLTVHDGVAPDVITDATAMSLLHESLHARHSTTLGSYPEAREEMHVLLRRAAEKLFNLLEDGRITTRGIAQHPELSAPLRDFLNKSGDQITAEARRHGNANTTEPVSQPNQLFYALQMRSLHPDSELVLHPEVAEKLAAFQPLMNAAQAGSTEDCGLTAVRLVEDVMSSGLPN